MSGGRLAWVAGYTMSQRVWSPCWDALPSYGHVGIDLPGHGIESATPMPKTLSGWAKHVVDRMRSEGTRDLVALSFGSSIALQVAFDFPDDVDHLVLAAPTISGRVDDAHSRSKYMAMGMAAARGVDGRRMADLWMAGPPDIFTGLRRFPEQFEHLAQIIADHSFAELRTGAMATLAFAKQDVAQLRSLKPDVLVLSGDQDMPLFRENAYLIEKHAPHATLVNLPGCGHLPLLEEPALSCKEIAAFIPIQ